MFKDGSRHEGNHELDEGFFYLRIPLEALRTLFEQGSEWGGNLS